MKWTHTSLSPFPQSKIRCLGDASTLRPHSPPPHRSQTVLLSASLVTVIIHLLEQWVFTPTGNELMCFKTFTFFSMKNNACHWVVTKCWYEPVDFCLCGGHGWSTSLNPKWPELNPTHPSFLLAYPRPWVAASIFNNFKLPASSIKEFQQCRNLC